MVWPTDTSLSAANNPVPHYSFLESLNMDFALPDDPVPSQTPQVQSSLHMPATPLRQQLWLMSMSSGGGMALGASPVSQNQSILAQLHATIARLERKKMEITLKHHELQSRLCETEKSLEKYVIDEARYGYEIPAEFDGPGKPEVFWYRNTYERLTANSKGLTGAKSTTNSEQLGYLVTPLGKHVSNEYEKTCLHFAYSFLNQLTIEGNTALSWSFVPADMKARFYKFMEDHFHLFHISAHHWKADKLGKQYYANWRKSHLEFINEYQRKLKVDEYVKAVTTGLVEKVKDGSLNINRLTLVLQGLANDDTPTRRSFAPIKEEVDIEVVSLPQKKRAAETSDGADDGKRLRLDETATTTINNSTTTVPSSDILLDVDSTGLLPFDDEDIEMEKDDISFALGAKENVEELPSPTDQDHQKIILPKNPLLNNARYSSSGLQDVTNTSMTRAQSAPVATATPSGSTLAPPSSEVTLVAPAAPFKDLVPTLTKDSMATGTQDAEPTPTTDSAGTVDSVPTGIMPGQTGQTAVQSTLVAPVQVLNISSTESTPVLPDQLPDGPTPAQQLPTSGMIALPGDKRYQPNKKSITACILCGVNWAVRNPQSSTKQYATHWASIEAAPNGAEIKKWKALADAKKVQKEVGNAT
ncbi:hypothetical protein BDZ89DRAFT_1054873 [Hymenopellis radicata]|nr:hypothetical protein BDZ89DRAFT_1054873 [Hymenopellis radicata]